MYKAIIFDLDGTLLNTLDDLFYATNYALVNRGLPYRTYDEIKKMVGNGVKKLIERSLPEDAKDQLDIVLTTFTEYYEKHKMDNTKPYPKIIEVLAEIKQMGLKMAIVSNKYQSAVTQICEPIFGNYINLLVGEGNGLFPKPAPDMINYALKVLNLNKEDVLFIGDSEVDVQTSINATIDMLVVSWGFRSYEQLLKITDQPIITDPYQIINYLKNKKDK